MVDMYMPAIVDAHLHLRQNDLPGCPGMLGRIAHYSGRCCDHVIAMPNTIPPIHDPDRITYMHQQYTEAMGYQTTVHMTAKWLLRTTPADVIAAKNAGAIGFKLYPQGATTNSDDGIPFQMFEDFNNLPQIHDVLGELEHQDMVLLCHGEAPGFCLDREDNFLPVLRAVSTAYPKLRVTLEHISTANGIKFVSDLSDAGHRILGTITLHHMMRDLDAVIGGKLQPDEFCMPIPKRPRDRHAIYKAAMNSSPCFALGSDSAPHDPKTKYCKSGCAGVFTAPVLIESLVQMCAPETEPEMCLQILKPFAIENASRFYGFEPSGRQIHLERRDWVVPGTAGLVNCFRAGETLLWSLLI